MALATKINQCQVVSYARCIPFSSGRIAPLRLSANVLNRRATPVVKAQAAAVEAEGKPQSKYHPSPLSQTPPSTYAVVEVGGRQMFLEPGKWYTCNRLKADVGSKIKFGRILFAKQDGKFSVGQPYLEKVNIEAEIIEELRGPKLIVYKMQRKKHYRKKQGHRQDLTKFLVTKIDVSA